MVLPTSVLMGPLIFSGIRMGTYDAEAMKLIHINKTHYTPDASLKLKPTEKHKLKLNRLP